MNNELVTIYKTSDGDTYVVDKEHKVLFATNGRFGDYMLQAWDNEFFKSQTKDYLSKHPEIRFEHAYTQVVDEATKNLNIGDNFSIQTTNSRINAQFCAEECTLTKITKIPLTEWEQAYELYSAQQLEVTTTKNNIRDSYKKPLTEAVEELSRLEALVKEARSKKERLALERDQKLCAMKNPQIGKYLQDALRKAEAQKAFE